MTRHKSRVARRSRRSARRGTRKQSGGGLGSFVRSLFGKNTDADTKSTNNPATQSAAELTTPTKSWLSRLFSSSNDDKANTQSLAPPATKPAETQSLAPANDADAPVQVGGRKKSRKTRHRRRSPRHHRK